MNNLCIHGYVFLLVSSKPGRSWFSGKIIASHAMASGSIPEGRIFAGGSESTFRESFYFLGLVVHGGSNVCLLLQIFTNYFRRRSQGWTEIPEEREILKIKSHDGTFEIFSG